MPPVQDKPVDCGLLSLNDFTVRDFSPTFAISAPPENVAITSTSFTSPTAGIGGQTQFQVNVTHSQGLVGQPITVTIRRSSTSSACVVSSPVGGEPEATQTKTGASSRQLTFLFPITLGAIESSACPGTVDYEASVSAPGISLVAAPVNTLTIQPSLRLTATQFERSVITVERDVNVNVQVDHSAGLMNQPVTARLSVNTLVTPSCILINAVPAQTKTVTTSAWEPLRFTFSLGFGGLADGFGTATSGDSRFVSDAWL